MTLYIGVDIHARQQTLRIVAGPGYGLGGTVWRALKDVLWKIAK